MAINHAKLLQKFNKINKRVQMLDDEEGEQEVEEQFEPA